MLDGAVAAFAYRGWGTGQRLNRNGPERAKGITAPEPSARGMEPPANGIVTMIFRKDATVRNRITGSRRSSSRCARHTWIGARWAKVARRFNLIVGGTRRAKMVTPRPPWSIPSHSSARPAGGDIRVQSSLFSLKLGRQERDERGERGSGMRLRGEGITHNAKEFAIGRCNFIDGDPRADVPCGGPAARGVAASAGTRRTPAGTARNTTTSRSGLPPAGTAQHPSRSGLPAAWTTTRWTRPAPARPRRHA